jgi:hypothetical protein
MRKNIFKLVQAIMSLFKNKSREKIIRGRDSQPSLVINSILLSYHDDDDDKTI